MDEPEISTLREETTSPTPLKVRPIKLPARPRPVGKKGAIAGKKTAATNKPANTSDDEILDDEDEEEDQLIDDDDVVPPAQRPTLKLSITAPSTVTPPAPKVTVKPKITKVAKEEAKRKDVSTSSAIPTNATPEPAHPSKTTHARRKAPTRKGTGNAVKPVIVQAQAPSASTRPRIKLSIKRPIEDVEVASDASVTAPSSPGTTHIEPTPEPEPAAPAAPIAEPPNLYDGPVPVYTLPTKPFPVLPPPKIGSGQAPTLVLDRSRKKVRHWRVAHREIKGIAGGRWFARAWTGSKESEYADSRASVVENHELLSGTLTAPPGLGSVGLPRSASANARLGSVSGGHRPRGRPKATPGTSRASSIMRGDSVDPSAGGTPFPSGSVSTGPSRPMPTKMRMIQMPVVSTPTPPPRAADSMDVDGEPAVAPA
ncbi:hypothetical protein FISHEDRAFT_69485 [Fistulina hepatica ATCC 64428]|uniref:Uncharacterized protein n=1 Tax=Fistulina hepatica ATCC 64428 TaxID=1128425 RepID=A0A0D7ALM4_9AGAR|nr:hypothetical protein FISHEDRAFT_69485 [Fistulina hepatica ATCC 64428]